MKKLLLNAAMVLALGFALQVPAAKADYIHKVLYNTQGASGSWHAMTCYNGTPAYLVCRFGLQDWVWSYASAVALEVVPRTGLTCGRINWRIDLSAGNPGGPVAVQRWYEYTGGPFFAGVNLPPRYIPGYIFIEGTQAQIKCVKQVALWISLPDYTRGVPIEAPIYP